jgi:hypothetical protein
VSQELGLPYARVRAFVKFERLRPELKRPVKSGELEIKAALRIEDYLGQQSPEPDTPGTSPVVITSKLKACPSRLRRGPGREMRGVRGAGLALCHHG